MTDRLRQLHEAATPAPWIRLWASEFVRAPWHADDVLQRQTNIDLITATRNVLPYLLDLIDAARALLPEEDDPLPEDEWDPLFLVLRDALAALDRADKP